jgi:16S rRNA (adenine1518-N6/adenine1519-N6)-dimethyltransferase
VYSVVLDVRWHASPQAEIGDEAFYAAVVHAAFGQRRKMLRNALAGLAGARGLDGAGLDAVFRAAGVDGRVRAETLSVDDFARLARGFDEA